MRRPTILTALLLVSVIFSANLLVASQQQRRGRRAPRKVRAVPAAASSPAAKSAKSAPTAAAAVVPEKIAVREIDVTALKKLLQRDPTAEKARPLLVNFWATWCDPCRDEFPDLVGIDRDYRARGLEFITVSLDEPAEINTTVLLFLREMRAGMPAYLLNTNNEPETAISAVDPTWQGELPATFLFDARGQIVFKHTGRINTDEVRVAIEKQIKQ